MTEHAKGDFKLTEFDEATYDDIGDGAKLTKALISQDLTGDFQGTLTSENLMCYSTDGTAVFLGFARMEGTLGGRQGTFVVRADGGYDGTEAKTSWTVLTGCGTGDFAGLTGTGESRAGHGSEGTYTLDFDLT